MKRLFGKKKPPKKAKEVLHSSRSPMNPKFQFAMKEYSQMAPPTSSNDDGHYSRYKDEPTEPTIVEHVPMAESTARRKQEEMVVETVRSAEDDDIESVLVDKRVQSFLQKQAKQPPSTSETPTPVAENLAPQADFTIYGESTYEKEPAGMKRRHIIMEPEMPDTTYEEHYGDAYIGAPIKYVYPSGYQSMRPRGGPWKLSIAICILFTWLSVFIVGHCSDQVDYSGNEIDDDTLVIETRWCGSRPLHLMWVASMLITGLAAAYCSVIGYIKIRDFAVANCRSQPPGMIGPSDYYVRITDDVGSSAGSISSPYQTTIYQADGTPQFWGGHIYRPTQAAVAVTSR